MRPENFTSTKSGWIVVYCAEFCELNLVHFFKWTELSSIIIPRKILNLNWTKFKFCRMNLNWTVFMKKVNLMITDTKYYWPFNVSKWVAQCLMLEQQADLKITMVYVYCRKMSSMKKCIWPCGFGLSSLSLLFQSLFCIVFAPLFSSVCDLFF